MNIKILKFIKNEGYCCLWAWFEVHRRQYTSTLMEKLFGVCEKRALQYQRAAYRKGKLKCTDCTACLKKKIKAGFPIQTTPVSPDKEH